MSLGTWHTPVAVTLLQLRASLFLPCHIRSEALFLDFILYIFFPPFYPFFFFFSPFPSSLVNAVSDERNPAQAAALPARRWVCAWPPLWQSGSVWAYKTCAAALIRWPGAAGGTRVSLPPCPPAGVGCVRLHGGGRKGTSTHGCHPSFRLSRSATSHMSGGGCVSPNVLCWFCSPPRGLCLLLQPPPGILFGFFGFFLVFY